MSTIAAVSTPLASGGIGVIRISGEDAISVADSVFVSVHGKRLCDLAGYSACLGYIFDGDTKLDECIATVYRAPKSYTGEDVVELSCHGGLFVTQAVLRSVLSHGAVAAKAGEFTLRAYLNGKMDLIEAENVMNIIGAQGQQALSCALDTLDGRLSTKIGEIKDALADICASICAWCDYPEDDVPDVRGEELIPSIEEQISRLENLIKTFDSGKAMTEGVTAVICGRPNVGKSSLMNAMTGYDRSIVTSIAGTTRDVVEETVRFGNVLFRLSDTAGLRATQDEVENIGVNLARKRIDRAQLILAVFDASEELNKEDVDLLTLCGQRRSVAILNKTDLEQKTNIKDIKKYTSCAVEVCANDGTGLDELARVCERLTGLDDIDTSAGVLTTERQRRGCENALTLCRRAVDDINDGVTLDAVNITLTDAVDALLELTGERAGEDVIEKVFANFCVGK